MMSEYGLLQANWLWGIPLVFVCTLLLPMLKKRAWIRKDAASNLVVVRHPLAMEYQTTEKTDEASNNLMSSFLLIISTCLFLLALAQPVKIGKEITRPATSADMLLLIDTSISMVMKDYSLDGQRVDRMTMTKVLLERFSQKFSGKKMGIVLIGDQAQIILPPTEDKALLSYMLKQLKPTIAGRRAALGDAVDIATDYIAVNNIGTQFSNDGAKNKETVLVLISSADSPAGKLSPIVGAEHAREKGVTLHTIAMGSSNMQKSRSGELIFESADLRLLQQMAEITGGQYFHAVDVASMDNALRSIEKNHQIMPDRQNVPRLYTALYHWPLITALLIIILNALMPQKTRPLSKIVEVRAKKSV